MVKHVYYKKQATGNTWHLLSEMDKQTWLKSRRERAKKRQEQIRQDQLIIEYFKVKYPIHYEEALKYYTSLNENYPTVRDLRKTWRFKDFKTTTKTCDNMLLEIPLTKTIMNEAKGTLKCHETNTTVENVGHILPGEETISEESLPGEETISEESVVNINALFPDIDMSTLKKQGLP